MARQSFSSSTLAPTRHEFKNVTRKKRGDERPHYEHYDESQEWLAHCGVRAFPLPAGLGAMFEYMDRLSFAQDLSDWLSVHDEVFGEVAISLASSASLMTGLPLAGVVAATVASSTQEDGVAASLAALSRHPLRRWWTGLVASLAVSTVAAKLFSPETSSTHVVGGASASVAFFTVATT